MAVLIPDSWRSGVVPGGWKRDRPDCRDKRGKPQQKQGMSSVDIDLRKTGFLPPVYQQFDTNACTSMVVGAAIEYQNRKERKPDFKPSKLFMYWNARYLENCTQKDDGAEIRDVMKAIGRWGVAPDHDFPFTMENLLRQPPENAYLDAKKEIINKYRRVANTKREIIATLQAEQPVIFGLEIFDNFANAETNKTGYIKKPKGKHKSSHALLIVGIKDGKWFIVRNSWGYSWGEQGYGYVPIDYVENDNLASDFWTLEFVP